MGGGGWWGIPLSDMKITELTILFLSIFPLELIFHFLWSFTGGSYSPPLKSLLVGVILSNSIYIYIRLLARDDKPHQLNSQYSVHSLDF